MKKHQLLTLLMMSIVYVVWGSTFYGVKLGLEGGLPPFCLIGLRFMAAGAVLYGLSRARGSAAPRAGDWKESALLGFLLLVLGPGLVAWSEQYVSSSLAALLVATSPVWVTLLDREQKLNPQRWLGLSLGLVGVGWLVGASLSLDGEGFLLGAFGCLASALAWAVGSLRARRVPSRLSPLTRAGMQMLCAGVMLMLLAFASGENLSVALVSREGWMALGYLTVFGSLVAYSAYTWLVGNVSAAVLSTHAYVNPVVAVLLGSLLGGEEMSPQTGLAAAVALVGVVILMLPNRADARRARALVALDESRSRVGSGFYVGERGVKLARARAS